MQLLNILNCEPSKRRNRFVVISRYQCECFVQGVCGVHGRLSLVSGGLHHGCEYNKQKLVCQAQILFTVKLFLSTTATYIMDTSTAQNLGILWISGPTYRRFISSILTYVIDIPPSLS